MLRKYITNNIRRYTHTHTPTHNSPLSNKKLDTITVEEKMDKIMKKLDMIDILVKCNYAVSVLLPGLILLFK